jgi:hypothetical protein
MVDKLTHTLAATFSSVFIQSINISEDLFSHNHAT